MSEHTSATIGNDVKKQIAALYDRAVSHGSRPGFFVSKDRLRRLEASLDELMNGQKETSVSPTALIELNEQLQAVTTRAEQAEARLAANKQAEAVTSKNLEEADLALKAKEQLLAKTVADNQKERESLQAQVKTLRKEVDTMRKTSTSSPEEAQALKDKLALVQKQLEAINTEKKAAISEVRNAKDQVAALRAHLQVVEAAKIEAESAKMAASTTSWAELAAKMKDEPLQELDPIPDFDSSLLRKAFPPETMVYVKAAAEARQKGLRDYAFQISALANKTDPRSFVGMKDYAWALYQKVKDTPPKDRSQYRQVLDDVYNAITVRGAKKLKEIRAEYASLLKPSPDEVDEMEIKSKARKATWWESFKADVWRWRSRLSFRFRWAKAKANEASRFNKIVAFCKGFCSALSFK